DIVLYVTPFHLFAFIAVLVFTALIAMSKTETQVEAEMGTLNDNRVGVGLKEFKVRRFLAIVCGLATAGAMITGDLFNLTLFIALTGIVNVGIVAAVKQIDVLEAAYNYGIIAMISSLPLFGGAAIILASTGTLSLFVLSSLSVSSPMMIFGVILLLIGVAGETGVAPFFATKAEMFRTPGSPFILIIHLSSLMIIVRIVEVSLMIIKPF
ncbi:MAG: proton-conducting transporter membrane subunit, partial [Methanobacteriaceae archaeon]